MSAGQVSAYPHNPCSSVFYWSSPHEESEDLLATRTAHHIYILAPTIAALYHLERLSR